MSAHIGLEITPSRVRVVERARWRSAPRRTHEIPCDVERPRETVAELRAAIGRVSTISVALGLGLLHVKHVQLPSVPLTERRRMLVLEPDRFFAASDTPLVVALAEPGEIAFAADAALVNRWLAALDEWAPVDRVVPSPIAIARADATLVGRFTIEAGTGEVGEIELVHGALRSVRRRRAPDESATSIDARAARTLPSADLAALGATITHRSDETASLVPDDRRERQRARSRRGTTVAAVACAASLAFVLWGLEGAREQRLVALEAEAARLASTTRSAMAAEHRLLSLEREAAVLRAVRAEQRDWLAMLAALSERLPDDAVVLNLRAIGDDWQIDGTAPNAASLVPLLDRDPRFENVRSLTASSRFRDDRRTYETFSIALRILRRP
jgi:Tfp pilus assembly protein PilN